MRLNKQLASSHSLSLILTPSLSIYHLVPLSLSLSPPPFFHFFWQRRSSFIIPSQITKGMSISYNMIQLSLICSECIMHRVTQGVAEMYFHEYFLAFSFLIFTSYRFMFFSPLSLLVLIWLQDIYHKWRL